MRKFEHVLSGHARPGVSAVRFFYKLCGSSQPSILQASDGAFYVVKFNGFPGSQALANEVVGTALIRRAGLPAPDWMPIEVSSDFLDQNHALWFNNNGHAPIRPRPGIHFGSRLIEASGERRTYQIIPHSWIKRVQNRADFLGMLVLDLWANNCDRRQAVYLSTGRGLQARFIDNDFMFGGKFGYDRTCPRRAMVHDLSLYSGLWNEDSVQQWLEKFDGISENTIRRIVASVPEEWVTAELRRRILSQLLTRRSILPRLLNDARHVLASGYSISYHRPRHATEPAQIRGTSVLPLQ
ncbi:MAG TPA: HipA family kinase [Acidobacteriaceae bacterium]|nr:HipA family kinase [Acidobacteriaceae bacterium]